MNGDPKQSPLSPIKQAYLKLSEMQARLDATEEARREPVAIVGMACRFPGRNNDPESFWQFLRAGGNAIREVPNGLQLTQRDAELWISARQRVLPRR